MMFLIPTESFSQRSSKPEDKLVALEQVHKRVYSLPYEYDYIRGTIMAEAEAKRIEIAPNFPKREDLSEGGDYSDLFISWVSTYPEEYDRYILYIQELIKKYGEKK